MVTVETTRVVLGVEYNGSPYQGWQAQKHTTDTVQAELEAALQFVANEKVRVFCAGRTDSGVHALTQVVHFDTKNPRTIRAWIEGTNTRLSHNVRVRWAQFTNKNFHARFSAFARRYCYVIDNRAVRSALMNKQLSWQRRELDTKLMQEAADMLVGEHDFTSFRHVHCQAKSPVKTVYHLNVKRRGYFVTIDIKANAFLHHMVRNIAGVLMAIGYGKQNPEWCRVILDARDRRHSGETAPPFGLYLIDIDYPEEFAITKMETELPFLINQ
jgi:tRNA pseudouridine38-40 synthase